MSVELYVAKEFDTTYEREALSFFVRSMGDRFGKKDDLYIILANDMIGKKHVDLTVVKRDAVLVIELKDCREAFTAYSNQVWKTVTGKLIGRDGYNPHQQVDDYRNEWIKFLKEHKRHFSCLKNFRDTNKPFCYTKSYVAIFPSLMKGYSNKISDEIWWFRLCGVNELDEKISNETNEIINFSNDELRFIATELLSMGNPKVIQTTNNENLAEQIKKGVDNLANMLEEIRVELNQKENTIHSMKIAIDENERIVKKNDSFIVKMNDENSKFHKNVENLNNIILQLEREKSKILIECNEEK